jgi:hypothetical protein
MSKWICGESAEDSLIFPAAVLLAASRGFVGIVEALLCVGVRPFDTAAAAAFGGFAELVDLIVEAFPEERDRAVFGPYLSVGIPALKYGLSPLEGFVASGRAVPANFESLSPCRWERGQVVAVATSDDADAMEILERLLALKGPGEFVEMAFEEVLTSDNLTIRCGLMDGRVAALILRVAIAVGDRRAENVVRLWWPFEKGVFFVFGRNPDESKLLFVREFARFCREDPSLVSRFRSLDLDFGRMLSDVIDVAIESSASRDGAANEVIDEFVMLFGDDWSEVKSRTAWSRSSPAIWRRLAGLRLQIVYGKFWVAGEAKVYSMIVPVVDWIESRETELDEDELLIRLECVLAVGGDFRTFDSFSAESLRDAPRAAQWLIDHEARVIPVESRQWNHVFGF